MVKKYHVAVVGATGAVGQEMLRMLFERKFPVASIRALASERSKGRTVAFGKQKVKVETLTPLSAKGIDVALFSAGATVSKEYAPIFVKAGAVVIDNSSAWRMEPDIPLVVPEVNPHVVSSQTRLIANPNCSTIQMVVALEPLHQIANLRRVIVSTYQSTSGAGALAMEELKTQTAASLAGKRLPEPKKLPATIAFNCIPQIDVFLENGYTKEEMKMTHETRKIMELPDLPVSATTVRVPVFRSHSEAVWAEFERPLSAQQARDILTKAPGVVVVDDPAKKRYPMAIDVNGHTETYVGRIRQDIAVKNGLVFWVVADNLLKGAASNAVQIAELMHEKGYLEKP
jgi:aspartate-semialdehyde dehydrogenase